jgi:methionine--tRNA ligase beta chain
MSTIPFETFGAVDLRVGKVISAERVEGSLKLIKLQIDLGSLEAEGCGNRQILAGIGKVYEPENLVGTLVCVVANLAPRMMMGFESQGMLLAAGDPPTLLRPAGDVAPGSKIR